MEQNLLTAISSVGFPIVVTLYLLTSFQRSMDRFTAQLSELVKELQQQRHLTPCPPPHKKPPCRIVPAGRLFAPIYNRKRFVPFCCGRPQRLSRYLP